MNKRNLRDFLLKNYNVDKTVELAFETASDKISIRDVLELCSDSNPKIAFRASWLLEYAQGFNDNCFMLILNNFLKDYPSIKNSSVQRCFTKILIRITDPENQYVYQIEYSQIEECISATFDWLLNTKTPVAVQANCLDIIFQTSIFESWIKPELLLILEQKIISDSPALVVRARMILKKMK